MASSPDRFGRGDHGLLDGITDHLGVGVEQGSVGRTISTPGTVTIPRCRLRSANTPVTPGSAPSIETRGRLAR
jgi:hypothetical protein